MPGNPTRNNRINLRAKCRLTAAVATTGALLLFATGVVAAPPAKTWCEQGDNKIMREGDLKALADEYCRLESSRRVYLQRNQREEVTHCEAASQKIGEMLNGITRADSAEAMKLSSKCADPKAG